MVVHTVRLPVGYTWRHVCRIVAVKPRAGKDREITPVDLATRTTTVVKVSGVAAVDSQPVAGKDREITPVNLATLIQVGLHPVAHRPDLGTGCWIGAAATGGDLGNFQARKIALVNVTFIQQASRKRKEF